MKDIYESVLVCIVAAATCVGATARFAEEGII